MRIGAPPAVTGSLDAVDHLARPTDRDPELLRHILDPALGPLRKQPHHLEPRELEVAFGTQPRVNDVPQLDLEPDQVFEHQLQVSHKPLSIEHSSIDCFMISALSGQRVIPGDWSVAAHSADGYVTHASPPLRPRQPPPLVTRTPPHSPEASADGANGASAGRRGGRAKGGPIGRVRQAEPAGDQRLTGEVGAAIVEGQQPGADPLSFRARKQMNRPTTGQREFQRALRGGLGADSPTAAAPR